MIKDVVDIKKREDKVQQANGSNRGVSHPFRQFDLKIPIKGARQVGKLELLSIAPSILTVFSKFLLLQKLVGNFD